MPHLGAGFVREEYHGLDDVVPMPEIDIELPLADIYHRFQVAPELEDEP